MICPFRPISAIHPYFIANVAITNSYLLSKPVKTDLGKSSHIKLHFFCSVCVYSPHVMAVAFSQLSTRPQCFLFTGLLSPLYLYNTLFFTIKLVRCLCYSPKTTYNNSIMYTCSKSHKIMQTTFMYYSNRFFTESTIPSNNCIVA